MDILAFCRKRDLSTENIKISQTVDWNTKKTDQSKLVLQIELPADFPDKYEKTIAKLVDNCLVARVGKGIDPSSFEKEITRTQSQ